MADVAFWMIVLLTIGSAVVVVHHEKLLYSAIALLFTLFGVAGLYIFLWADFLAAVQIVIYIGGILVLVIFGIMLTHNISSVSISQPSLQKGVGGLLVASVLGSLGLMITKTPWLVQNTNEPIQTVETIGHLLMMDYLLPFEVASVLLLGALIGAATLSRRED
ncbi:MAG: NADH-quinone oxidoreductase subunit J [Candidatus Marinimicrobia bacterium]|jgi:NADH-quinone oxidoreductase subunit J|nr:NADH-quinone oxidoreductase subunit J [Candidatus Neomarinimicrobiota bacterium]MBT3618502.1 NADH-quinone oxidoreductase subunit J [Candidatus Neomarinimicrobiota bacterium]MBT3828908.1 NADH-quinone oxidoreductase subunit J [Candidatus Neomarinimicrobiota bacterium]MBT3997292.1 NADH-quinone oxidoreductase subunit J [Candidatus Neomarinimicrobiota bacterium]MBT4281186.1 NADH-quinone oxidoreductase subunit J [Candidatus Neomarinimicrobiota bacterium]